MRLIKKSPVHALVLLLSLVTVIFVGCVPTSTPHATTAVLGCSAGGRGVFTPEDVQCYLANADTAEVQMIDEETVVLLADAQSIVD